MFRLDYHHTGCKEGDAPDTNDLFWTFNTTTNNRWVVSSPMIVDDYVYIGSDNGNLYKLYFNNGTQVWNYTTGSSTIARFWSSPCVDKENNMVFAHSNGLHAINMTSGEQIWYFETTNREFCSPTVYNGIVYIGSYDKHVYAVDEFTGDLVWYYEAGEYQNGQHVEGSGGAVSTTLAITDGKLFGAEQTRYDSSTNYCDYNIFCIPPEDPDGSGVIEHDEIIWKYEIGEHLPLIDFGVPIEGGDSFSSPTINIELEQVYIGSRDMYFYCFALEPDGDGLDNDGDGIFDNEGELLWRTAVDNEIYSTPSIHNGTVFFGSGQYNSGGDSGSVYALEEATGSLIWRYRNADGFLSSALVADGKVYIGCNDDRLYAFDEENGTIIWEYHATGSSQNAIGSSPALYKETIVVGSCNGYVYAFRTGDQDANGDQDGDDDSGWMEDISNEPGSMAAFGFLIMLILIGALMMLRKMRGDVEDEEEEDEVVEEERVDLQELKRDAGEGEDEEVVEGGEDLQGWD